MSIDKERRAKQKVCVDNIAGLVHRMGDPYAPPEVKAEWCLLLMDNARVWREAHAALLALSEAEDHEPHRRRPHEPCRFCHGGRRP